jgi:transcriptional regulator with XRE-family HTH domain
MRKERLAKGWTLIELAAQTGIDAPHLGRVESGKRPPTLKIAGELDRVFPNRKGYFTEWVEETQDWPEIPATFRSWGDFEDKTATLRSWMPSVVDGLVQTEEYARVLLGTLPGVPAETVNERVRIRIERQRRVLGTDDPPAAWFIVDEMSLYREVGSPEIMASQLRHLVTLAARPKVSIQVLPAVHHNANASGLLLADDAAWCEHLASGYVFTDAKVVSVLAARFDTLRGECMKVSESTALLGRMADQWETGVSPLSLIARAASA